MARYARRVHVATGARIFDRGDEAKHVYAVVGGRLKVYETTSLAGLLAAYLV